MRKKTSGLKSWSYFGSGEGFLEGFKSRRRETDHEETCLTPSAMPTELSLWSSVALLFCPGINFRPPPPFSSPPRIDNNIAVSKGHGKNRRRTALEIDEVTQMSEGFVM